MEINFALVADIINKHLKKNGYEYIQVTVEEIAMQGNGHVKAYDKLLPGSPYDDFCVKLFQSLSEDQSEKHDLALFHFKDAPTAIKILQQKILQASHLPIQSKEDEEEYVYFMKQIEHELVTDDKPIPDKMLKVFGGFLGVDAIRDQAHIICFTKTDSKEYFWNKYAAYHSGVCFRFKYNPTGDKLLYQLIPKYYLRDMIYDNELNNKFSFLAEMNRELKKNVGYELMITMVHGFAAFYKRNRYKVEDEIRFAVLLSYFNAWNHYEIIEPKQDGNRKYIPIPIKGHDLFFGYEFPFELELMEIQCGTNMPVYDFEKIQSIRDSQWTEVPIKNLKDGVTY